MDLGDIRRAYQLERGKRVRLKLPFAVKKLCPTWPHQRITSLGHNHAYTEGGTVVGLVALEPQVKAALVEHAKTQSVPKKTSSTIEEVDDALVESD